jgi:hypothetical protein
MRTERTSWFVLAVIFGSISPHLKRRGRVPSIKEIAVYNVVLV